MRIHALARIGAAFALSALVVACGGGSPAVPNAPYDPNDYTNSVTDEIGFGPMLPVVGTSLARGQTVTFSGIANYTLNTASSAVGELMVLDQADQDLQPAGSNPTAMIAKGAGQIHFSETVTLPASGVSVVKVLYVLSPAGGTKKTIRVSYPVE